MRISRDTMFMEFARVASKRATCFRLNVGAVLVADDKRVISIGYNGPPSGEPHCTGAGCAPSGSGCVRSVHAEINALNVLRTMPNERRLTLYVTASPCRACALAISGAAVMRVVYESEYRDTEPLNFLCSCGVQVERLLPSGQRIDFDTGRLI